MIILFQVRSVIQESLRSPPYSKGQFCLLYFSVIVALLRDMEVKRDNCLVSVLRGSVG